MSALVRAVRCLALSASCAAFDAAPAAEPATELSEREIGIVLTLSPLAPPPTDTTNRVAESPVAAAFGQRLFFDTRLSGNGKIACATCHDAARGWSDGRTVAVGAATGTRNTPSLWNAAHNRWFFWDGRADSLWAQAVKPIEDGAEMNGDRLSVLHLIARDARLRRNYEGLFGALPAIDAQRFPPRGGPLANDGARQANWWAMTSGDRDAVSAVLANVGKAIAAYVATIRTAPAPFDRFVTDLRAGRMRSNALSAAAQRGLKTFIGKGKCVLCHSGPSFTNFEFHDTRAPPSAATSLDSGRLGGVARLMADEFGAAGPHSDDATGVRALQAHFVSDTSGLLGHFKTPGLRNVALTAPYMHAGQLQSLTEVVEHYSSLKDASPPADPEHVEALIAPIGLDATEIADLVEFLESLTSETHRGRRGPKTSR